MEETLSYIQEVEGSSPSCRTISSNTNETMEVTIASYLLVGLVLFAIGFFVNRVMALQDKSRDSTEARIAQLETMNKDMVTESKTMRTELKDAVKDAKEELYREINEAKSEIRQESSTTRDILSDEIEIVRNENKDEGQQTRTAINNFANQRQIIDGMKASNPYNLCK